MNKADLVIALTKVLSTKKEANDALECIFSNMKKSLRAGDKVVVSEFGSFHPKIRHARKARNIKLNQVIDVPSKKIVKFYSSKNLLED